MKNKEKQIEEMAKDKLIKVILQSGGLTINMFGRGERIIRADVDKLVNNLIESGLIVPQDSVVLSREEYEKLKNLSSLVPKLSLENLKLKEEQKEMQKAIVKDNSVSWLLKQDRKITEKRVSNETAEKIYKDLKLLVPDNALGIVTRYFKEIIGVEIKE